MEGNWGGGGYCSASHPQLLLLLLILLIFNFFSLSVITAHLGSLERSRYQRASQEGAWGAGAGVSPARERSGAGPAPVLPPAPLHLHGDFSLASPGTEVVLCPARCVLRRV